MKTMTVEERPWSLESSDFPESGTMNEKMRFLVRYGVLAPSVHNTQPWAFSLSGNEIRLFADTNRCLRTADLDMRDLYLSLGCAIENVTIAAEHFGFHPTVHYLPHPENPMLTATITVAEDGGEIPSEVFGLFRAISTRRTNHDRYTPETVPAHELHHLTACALDDDVSLDLVMDDERKKAFASLLLQADVFRFSSKEYVDELAFWVTQGAYDTAWLVRKLHSLACLCRGGAPQKDPDVLKGAPVLGLICTKSNTRVDQLKAGRVLERVFLRATSLGLSMEPITYVLQVPETRDRVSEFLRGGRLVPQAPFRLGYSVTEPHHSPRRPLQEVVVDWPPYREAVILQS